jgi:hypothetical protein
MALTSLRMASNRSSTVTMRKVRVSFLGGGSFGKRVPTWDSIWARGGDDGLGWLVAVVVGELGGGGGGGGSGGFFEWTPLIVARAASPARSALCWL